MGIDPRFHPRRPPEERPRPFSGPRPAPFVPRPGGPAGRPGSEAAPVHTSFRLRDGEREIEVSGAAGFVRQVLEELPALVARLRGEAAPTPTSIRMPAPASRGDAGGASGVGSGIPARDADGGQPSTPAELDAPIAEAALDGATLEGRVLSALRSASHPLPVADIRGRVGNDVTGQQVRRILERAGSRVVATADRPIRYRLRSGT